jgi:hypothetical protein
MAANTLFTATELETVGIHLEEKPSINPHMIPLHDLETAIYGDQEIPLSAGLILPESPKPESPKPEPGRSPPGRSLPSCRRPLWPRRT